MFTEIIIKDFKISDFIEIDKIVIFKILAIQTYFVIIGIILYSFQVSLSFIKIPTLINFFLFILSVPLFFIFNKPENATNIAVIYLFLNVGWFFLNLFFLNKYFSKIFSMGLIIIFFKNFLKNFLTILIFMLISYFIIYDFSNLLFYLTLLFCFLYCLKVSQEILNKKKRHD